MTIKSAEIRTMRGSLLGYLVADEKTVLGVGRLVAPLAEDRVRRVERQPARFGGTPDNPDSWMKVVLGNTVYMASGKQTWDDGRNLHDIAMDLLRNMDQVKRAEREQDGA